MPELVDRPYVLSRLRDGVLDVTLNRSETLNALTVSLVWELQHVMLQAASNDAVRCVLLTGAGRAFSAGASLGGEMASGDEARADMREAFNPLVVAVRRMPKPVVAAVNGAAAGAGCSLALACDHVVLAESAFLSMAFVRVGLMPDGAALLTATARAGVTRATEMAMLGDRVSSAQALSWGLANAVVVDDEHAEAASAVARRFADGPPLALRAIKQELNRTVYAGLENVLDREAETQPRLMGTADCAEGVRAFIERRAPLFGGA